MIHANEQERELSELGYPVCHDERATDRERDEMLLHLDGNAAIRYTSFMRGRNVYE